MSYCTVAESEEFKILNEIASAQRNRWVSAPYGKNGKQIREKAGELAEERFGEAQKKLEEFKERLRNLEEELSKKALNDILKRKDLDEVAKKESEEKERKKLIEEIKSLEQEPQGVTNKDIENLLKRYERKGYIDIDDKEVKITPKGARILARGFLRKIMENLTKKGTGGHELDKIGYGPHLSRLSRSYELGDVYEKINIEKTFINTLESGRRINQLRTEDFEVYESYYQTTMNVGIIVDESGSMVEWNKIDAAIETALALSELIRTCYPEDRLRVFIFSEDVKEIPPWNLLNIGVSMRYTNIKEGMEAYRTAVIRERGDKQAYLITDSEPNYENGKYVGFDNAILGVLKEASQYRREEITLNIVMLDPTHNNTTRKKLASMMGKRNLGRVVFTTPENLGEAIIEDYLTSRREKL